MPKRAKLSRNVLIVAAFAAVAATIVFTLMPRPTKVDLGMVVRGDLTVTINQEGRTRVHETYVVSTPVALQCSLAFNVTFKKRARPFKFRYCQFFAGFSGGQI